MVEGRVGLEGALGWPELLEGAGAAEESVRVGEGGAVRSKVAVERRGVALVRHVEQPP